MLRAVWRLEFIQISVDRVVKTICTLQRLWSRFTLFLPYPLIRRAFRIFFFFFIFTNTLYLQVAFVSI